MFKDRQLFVAPPKPLKFIKMTIAMEEAMREDDEE
jgi:hypothetical protein